MNTITKIILSLVLPIACTTALYAQLPCEQKKQTAHKSVEYCVPRSNVNFEESTIRPFHPKVTSFRGGIIKPVKAVEYNPLTGYPIENPFTKYNYFYDTTGRLLKEIRELLINKEIGITTYSNKFLSVYGYNDIDTSTLYKSANMEPVSRYYYEYEIEQAEPYIARVTQQWNKSKARLDNIKKYSCTYLDTISWYVTVLELYDSGPDNSLKLYYRETHSLVYDENNNVFQVEEERTDMVATAKTIYEYYYPVDAHDNMTGYDSIYIYNYDSNSAFYSAGKQTGITWTRWDGFDYESNQMASFYGWNLNEDEGWDLWGLQKYWYDVDGIAGSWSDTIYFYSNLYEHWYTKATDSETYNEQGDLCVNRNIGWQDIDLTGGVLELEWYNIDSYINEYNDDGLLWRTSNYYTSLKLGYENYLFYIWEVTEFADVSIVAISELPPSEKQLLIIAPNPVSGIVTISATEDIEQLYIFDVTGRLVNSQSPANRQVIFDTGVLPKGVYLVQARLKDGGVQTGKLIVR